MPDILNTPNYNIENPAFARKKSQDEFSRFSEAPSSLPTYSVNQKLREKDEFRKSVTNAFYEEKRAKEKRSTIKKILAIGAAIGTFLILEAKKII